MAAMAGKDGLIKVGTNTIGYIDNFSININNSTSEINSLGKSWKEYIETGKDWSGSASGTLDYADLAQKEIVDKMLADASGEFTLEMKVNSNLTFTGSVIFNSMSPSSSWGDKIAISFNFVGTGTLSKKEST